jgi:5-methylcytosine-specific restriction endonuclease McrA
MVKKLPYEWKQPCGSWGAYKRHLRKGEQCQVCLDGEAERRRKKGIPEKVKRQCGVNAYSYKLHVKNKEPICDTCRELRNAGIRENYKKTREHRLKKQKANYQKNLEHKRELTKRKGHRRRARLRGSKVEPYVIAQVLEAYGTDCHICKEPIDMKAPRSVGKEKGWEKGLHIDHLIPISQGGSDTLENVRPAHGLCNVSKGAKVPQ